MKIHDDFLRLGKVQDIGRWHITHFVEEVAGSLPKGAALLDAGAGECAYKRLFPHCDYKAIDLAVGESRWNYGNLDYVGPLHDMPIQDATFNAVLCTQVLEHLEWPRESVREMHRVLKPGGRLFLTAPMAQAEHQAPHDYFRYTSYGLESICRHAGFGEIAIRPLGGLYARWAYELPRGLSILPPTGLLVGAPNIRGIVLCPVRLTARAGVALLQRLFLWCDRFDTVRNDPLGWSCIATKPPLATARE